MQLKPKAFTIFEIVVVVVILGILAAVAIPRLTRSNEKMIASEAKNVLIAIFNEQVKYKESNGVHANNINLLDIDIPAPQNFINVAATTNLLQLGMMTRNAPVNGYELSIGQDGVIYCRNATTAEPSCNSIGCPGSGTGTFFPCNN
jgi:prepilin-type N-terminal cleavage/methylation domain-containing protein